MKIANLETYVVANPVPYKGAAHWEFLKLETDDGIKGFGEAYGVPFHPKTIVRLIEDIGERYVIG